MSKRISSRSRPTRSRSVTQKISLIRLAAILAAAFGRIREHGEVALKAQRLAEAQELASLGSYDWHIATDTNVWSDELYRYAPGAFNASYERFLSMIHPEDRERIIAIHTKALEINDNVVQGLTAVLSALEMHRQGANSNRVR